MVEIIMSSVASASSDSTATSPSPVDQLFLPAGWEWDDPWPAGDGETKPPPPPPEEEEHPRRPGQPDCSYYVKFGSCKFGMMCIYNHPDREHRLGFEAGGSGGDKLEHPLRPGQPDCYHYLLFRRCKHGMSCRYNHPPPGGRMPQQTYCLGKAQQYNNHDGKSDVEKVKLNLHGLPLRPGLGLCSYYMDRGFCKFGTGCKFHHPDQSSDQEINANQASSQVNIYSVLDLEELNEQPVPSQEIDQPRNSRLLPVERTCYTRDQLLQLRQTVDVPKDILELTQHINVELAGEDQSWLRNETINVQIASYKRFDETDSREWRPRSVQTPLVKEGQSGDKICQTKHQYALCWNQEQLNNNDQVGPISCAKTEEPWSIRKGNPFDKDGVLKRVKGILSILTPEKFDHLKGQLIEPGITRADILKDVINLILEKAVAEPTFCPMYAQLCSYLNKNLKSFPREDPDGEENTFKRALSTKCLEIFESTSNVRAEIYKLTGPDKEMERRDKEMLVKLQTLGNIRLVRALLTERLVTKKIVQHIVQAVMECDKFLFEPLGKVDLLNILFEGMTDSVSAGNESNMGFNASGDKKCSMAANDVEIINKDVDRLNEQATLPKSFKQNDNMWPAGGGETAVEEEHPRRPGQPDCTYYVKFGTCKFGMRCVYNHPDRKYRLGFDAGGGDKLEQHPRRPGEPDCSHYGKFGSCKFGTSCRFNHPEYPGGDRTPQQMYFPRKAYHHHHEGKTEVEQVELNLLGFPLRPGTALCSYYINRGICKFGTNCKFHHPADPGLDQEKAVTSRHANQESSQVNAYSVLDQGESDEQSDAPQEVHQKTGDSIQEAKVPALGWKQEQFNRHGHDQRFQFDSEAQYTEHIDAREVRYSEKLDVIGLILQKAITEPTFCKMYAQLCSYLNENLTLFPPEDPGGEEITFKRALANRCQETFESTCNLWAEIYRSGPDQEMDRRDKERLVKLQTLGNMHLLKELIKQKLVTDKMFAGSKPQHMMTYGSLCTARPSARYAALAGDHQLDGRTSSSGMVVSVSTASKPTAALEGWMPMSQA
uniref:C3H1-type domain-containing protein n=1 Tax=Leersia perrieri TaxID=77586 RepID=A0A0D9WQS2_9ORYZ